MKKYCSGVTAIFRGDYWEIRKDGQWMTNCDPGELDSVVHRLEAGENIDEEEEDTCNKVS